MNLEIMQSSFFDELTKIAYVTQLLSNMDKYAESLGVGAARAGNGVNPTLTGLSNVESAYNQLDHGTKKLIESHPLVTQHGMTPHAALSVAHMSKAPEQSFGQFFAQQHGMGSGNMFNNVAKAPAATMATNAGRMASAPVAAAAKGVGGIIRKAPGLKAIASGIRAAV